MVNHIPPSIDGTSEVIDVVLAPDKASSSNKPDLDPDTAPASTHETISISSSPVGSPEIEIAEVEDYDQDPSQTRWTGRVGGATTSRSIQPFYMRSTFPHAREYKVGDARLAVSRLAKSLGEPARDPGAAFVQVKAWLTAFLDACDDLTEAIYEEDVGFWSRLHQIPEALLKREQHSLTTVSLTELIDFFLAWGRLTQLMFRLELRRCAAILQGTEKIEKLALGTSWAYLIPITWLLGEKCTLLGSLQKHHRLDPMLIIKPCFHQLMHPKEINLVKSITDLVSEMIPVFHKSHRFIKDVGLLSIPLGNLLGLLGLVSISLDLGEADVSAALDNLREGLEASLTGIDRLLQESIRKQSPWLTMDTGSELVHQMQDLFGKLGAEVPGFARQLICASGVSVDDADYTYLELVANHAWKFTIWHKFLRHGRMELRVCGVDRMCGELVIVFTNFIRDSADGRQNPLVKYLNRFLRENEIIPYVISAESHPQIIQRSANLVGFLSVSHTYTTADTDIIWNAAIEGEDPRTNQEILALLQRCFETAEEAHVVYVCQKLLTLASSRFDTRMLDFARSALVALRDKAQNHHAFSQYFNAPASYDPVGRILCLRLIRVVNALHSKLEYWPIFQDHFVQLLPTFLQASREQGRCLAVSEEEEDDILEAIRRDIEAHAEASMGAIVVVNCMLHLKMLLEDSKIFVIDRCGLPQALVDEIAVLSANLPRETFQVRPYIDPPLTCLSHCLTLVPEKFTDTHLDSLWCSVLTGQSVHPDLRNHAWEILISIIRYSRQPNPAINRILSHYWPKLQPSDFSKAVLDFAVQSIAYETAISSQTMVAPGDVVVIPGIERVWTIMLDAPSGTVETEATDFVIGQYLRSQLIVKAPRESVRATQLKLIDRCVNQVLGSASRLKSFAEVDFRSDPDESTVIIASAEEIHIEESRFDRSLLFLRRFTEAVKVNPTCSPIASRQFDGLPEFPKKKGESLEFKVQIFGNKYLSEAQRSVSVGKANTGADLWEYLSKISGFSSFAVINNGKSRTDLQEETSTLEDLKIARGALFVRKIENTVEAMPRARLRQCSPVDEKIILHFDDLYGLLESDDRLAKEVYDFLNITTVKEKVSQLARSMETPALELLSSDKPYKLLFSAQALRSPVEQESFNNNSPDGEFLSYAVKAIITAFMRLAGSDFVGALSKTIAQELLDTLLMAFRAKVPTEVSREFLSGYDGFLDVILKYFVAILGADGQELQRIKVHEMTQAAFEVLVEARLQNESSWGQLTNDETVRGVFAAALLFDNRESVRQSILDVVLGLTGATGSKLVPKPDSRAARARYDSTTIESTLKQVWELIVEVLPMTDRHNAQCQQLFDTALVILRRIGKSFELDLLQSLFEQWSEALLRHEGYEVRCLP
jgi:ubiquitin carboxyl-terminal hydrolase 34